MLIWGTIAVLATYNSYFLGPMSTPRALYAISAVMICSGFSFMVARKYYADPAPDYHKWFLVIAGVQLLAGLTWSFISVMI